MYIYAVRDCKTGLLCKNKRKKKFYEYKCYALKFQKKLRELSPNGSYELVKFNCIETIITEEK